MLTVSTNSETGDGRRIQPGYHLLTGRREAYIHRVYLRVYQEVCNREVYLRVYQEGCITGRYTSGYTRSV